MVECVMTRHRRVAWTLRIPRAKSAGCMNLSLGHRVGQLRVIRPWGIRAHVMQNNVLEFENLRILIRLCRCQ